MAQKKQAIQKWDAELAKLAAQSQAIVDNLATGGNFIKTAGGRLSFQGAEIPGNKMNVVVIDHVLHNADYDGDYDPSNPQSPRCYAFGRTLDEMAPHDKSAEPQCGQCKGCPMNEFGTADRGKGKHCKNIVRLALLAQSELEEDVAAAEVTYMHVPVTSVKGWAGYVKQIGEVMKRPPLGVITEVSLTPDPKSQFKVNFKLVEPIEDSELLGALISKHGTVNKDITFPYAEASEKPAPAAKGKGGKGVPARAQNKRTKF